MAHTRFLGGQGLDHSAVQLQREISGTVDYLARLVKENPWIPQHEQCVVVCGGVGVMGQLHGGVCFLLLAPSFVCNPPKPVCKGLSQARHLIVIIVGIPPPHESTAKEVLRWMHSVIPTWGEKNCNGGCCLNWSCRCWLPNSSFCHASCKC